jgi:hypothetical protein
MFLMSQASRNRPTDGEIYVLCTPFQFNTKLRKCRASQKKGNDHFLQRSYAEESSPRACNLTVRFRESVPVITEPWRASALLYPLPEYCKRSSGCFRRSFGGPWVASKSRSTLRTVSMQGLLYEWEDKITTIRFYRISESWLLLILHTELTRCVYLERGTCQSPIVLAMTESVALESLFLPLSGRNIISYGCVRGKSFTKPVGF